MQLQNSKYATVSQAFRSVYKTEGISAFYVSYPTTLVMTIPFTAVQFTVYEFLCVTPFSPIPLLARADLSGGYRKDVINPSGAYSPGTHMVAGGAAGAVAAAVSTPLDVMKTL